VGTDRGRLLNRTAVAAVVAVLCRALATPIFVVLIGLASWGSERHLLWHFVGAAVVLGASIGSGMAVGIVKSVLGFSVRWHCVVIGVGLSLATYVALILGGREDAQRFLLEHLIGGTYAAAAIGAFGGPLWSRRVA